MFITASIFGILSFSIRRLIYVLNLNQKKAILVGNEKFLGELSDKIKQNPQIGLKIISYNEDSRSIFEKYHNIRRSIFILDKNNVEFNEPEIQKILSNKNEILDVANAYEKYLYKIPVDYVSSSWIIENINFKKDISYSILSRFFEVIFSVFALILTAPLLLVVFVFIKLEDGGPIFYTQKRIGLNGKKFNIYKLRSMKENSEKDGAMWSLEKDPRVTKIGKVIRKLHIDEIPQMINIIKGDIGLVGPRSERPEFVEILEKEIPHYSMRHSIKPGFTGFF